MCELPGLRFTALLFYWVMSSVTSHCAFSPNNQQEVSNGPIHSAVTASILFRCLFDLGCMICQI